MFEFSNYLGGSQKLDKNNLKLINYKNEVLKKLNKGIKKINKK